MTIDFNSDDLLLSWPRPAGSWYEAAPVGNGRLGAMVFGGISRDRLQINDSTVWSGTPDSPAEGLAQVLGAGAGPERLAEVRGAIRAENYRLAESAVMSFEGRYSQEYLPFVDLWTSFREGEEATYHGRTLNIDNGVASDSFDIGKRLVQRRTWASRPARAVCVSVTVEGGALDFDLELTSQLRIADRWTSQSGFVVGVDVPVDGAALHEQSVAEPSRYGTKTANGYDPYAVAAVRVDTDGTVIVSGDVLSVRGMTRLLVTVSSSTSAEDFWDGKGSSSSSRREHQDRAVRRAENALAGGAEKLLCDHVGDLRPLLSAASLTIGQRRSGLVDVRDDILDGTDEHLTATVMFQLGRYLLASASRPGGGPPANLQGMWNAEIRPPWSSNYTININTEMNYWGAETAGLSECHLPLVQLVEKLAGNGTDVSRELYGARGWVAHHNTDMWGWALPVGMGHSNPSWAIWMMGGAWLTQHLWEHYEFTGDTTFLRDRGWPVLRGCAEFCLDWLVDGSDGWLDTIPSTSPENMFISAAGTQESLSYSSAMDMAMIRAVFDHSLEAAAILSIDDPICAEIRKALPRLRPPQVTGDGRLQEWVGDFLEQDPKHRHMSQMVGVYPLGQIDFDQAPELAAAAVKLLDARGPGAMGWSWAWKIALRARLGDGPTAAALLREATTPYQRDPDVYAPPEGTEWGGLLPNLFSTHPPFQMDGNFGLMAAMVELVVQSHGGLIRVLPALPTQWPAGELRGIRCRGGWSVDLSWRDGELSSLTIRSDRAEQARTVPVRYAGRTEELTLKPGEEAHFGPSFTQVGEA
jgi:alpha-L-fucosidase 2